MTMEEMDTMAVIIEETIMYVALALLLGLIQLMARRRQDARVNEGSSSSSSTTEARRRLTLSHEEGDDHVGEDEDENRK